MPKRVAPRPMMGTQGSRRKVSRTTARRRSVDGSRPGNGSLSPAWPLEVGRDTCAWSSTGSSDDMELFLAAATEPSSSDDDCQGGLLGGPGSRQIDAATRPASSSEDTCHHHHQQQHWYLLSDSGVVSWLDAIQRAEEQQRYLGTMEVAAAQVTKMVRLPQVLSPNEVEATLAWCRSVRDRCGSDDAKHADTRGWHTQFLHTAGLFAREQPVLRRKILAAALAVDKQQGWGLLRGLEPAMDSGRVPRFRCVELHTVARGGAITDLAHYDHGSLVTVDIMLSQPGATPLARSGRGPSTFSGGMLCSLELTDDGREILCSRPHRDFGLGDAIVFVSHKRHSVSAVESGCRQVLVAELWAGAESSCAHRCSSSVGSLSASGRHEECEETDNTHC